MRLRSVFAGLIAGLAFLPSAISGVPADTSIWYTSHSFDVQKYLVDMDIYACYLTPFPRTFSAREVITFRVDSTLNSISLNANTPSLAIDSVRLAGVSFTHEINLLNIILDRTYNPGDFVSVEIFYRHKSITDNGFYVSGGYVFTDSPPEGARKWFPCWDRPSDKALWELYAKVPVTVRLGSTGKLADSTLSGDTIRYHWISEHPVSTYLVTISSKTNFLIHTKYWHKTANPGDSLPVRIYYKTGENIANIDSLINRITDFFSVKFGDYPFEKIGFATLNAAFPWGGMENQTMVNLMPNGYSDANLIAHEHSHQWFGDLITCGTWADIWLNEGFATYCQNLWVEYRSGEAAYRTSMNSVANYYLLHNPGWPLYHPEWAINTPNGNTLYNTAVTYNKGACVLFMLRYVLGDSLFFKAMKDYTTDPKLIFGIAFTHDFIERVTQTTGKDLTWFFDEWVYSPNHPVYQNTYEIDSLGASRWRVPFVVNQVQSNAGFFTMPVEVMIRFNDGTDTTLKVFNDINNQEYAFELSRKPTELVFDPARNILLKQASTIYGIAGHSDNTSFRLFQNEPNPCSYSTRIRYEVPRQGKVKIIVFDLSGNQKAILVDRVHNPGLYQVDWQTVELAPGTYLYRLEAGKFNQTRKMVVTKP
jgi:aminopeptidase N